MPTIPIRWADNTNELRQNLKAGLDQIEATRAGAEKMARALGGENLIRAANNYVAAVNQVGGANKLTAAEQERVNALLDKAIAKYTALGQKPPQAMRDLANETKGATGALDKMVSAAGALGVTLGATAVLGALVSATKGAFDYADSLVKLSDKTGITITALQRMQAVAEPSGNSLDEVTSAVNKMQKNLSEANDKTMKSLGELGLSLKQLRDLSPDDQFFAIGKAIQSIKDPAEQTRIAMDLFGKAGAEILPTLKADIDGLKDSTVRLSEQAARGLDDLGDAFGRLKTSSKNMVGETVADYASRGQTIIDFWTNLGRVVGLVKMPTVNAPSSPTAPGTFKNGPSTGFPVPDNLPSVLRDSNAEIEKSIALHKKAQDEAAAHARAVRDLVDALRGQSKEQGLTLEAVAETIKAGSLDIDTKRHIVDALDKIHEAHGKIPADLEAWRKANFALGTEYDKLKLKVDAVNLAISNEAIGGLKGGSIAAQVDEAKKLMDSLDKVTIKLTGMDGDMSTIGETLKHSGEIPKPAFEALWNTLSKGQQVVATLASAFKKLPSLLIASFTGGGGIGSAFKAFSTSITEDLFGDKGPLAGITTKLSGMATKALSGLGKGLSSVLGSAVGGLLPGLGALLGPLALKLGSWIGGLFGNNAEKQINPVRQAFVDTAGGLAKLNERAAAAGVTLKAMLDAKNPEQYKKAIDDLNAALQFQDDAMATLDATVKKYGFSIEELGPAFSRQELDKKAGELFQDFKVLTAAGIDVDTVLGRMGGSINDFVHDALRTGTEIPAAMAPMLQRMVEMGTLTDENGNVITDLEKSGVHFSLTMSQGFEKIVSAVQKLTDAIARGLGLAIQNVPDVNVDVNTNYTTTGEPPNAPGSWRDNIDTPVGGSRGGMVTNEGISYFSRGKLPTFQPMGLDTIPAMLMPTEMVLTPSQQHAVGALLAQGGVSSRSSGSVSGGDSQINLHVQLTLPNGRVLTELVINNVAKDKYSAGTNLRKALQ